jgi:hypothetical protein
LVFSGVQTLDGTGTVILSNFSDSLHLLTSGTELTIGPNMTITGNNGTIGRSSWFGGPSNISVINQGTIRATSGGGSLELREVQTTTNTGNLIADGGTLIVNGLTGNVGGAEAINGGVLSLNGNYTNTQDWTVDASTLNLNGTWTNTATITVTTDSTVNLGGTFTPADIGTLNRTGGTVNLVGTLDNTGTTLPLSAATGGDWVLTGGTIQGGTVTGASGAKLIVSGGGAHWTV